VTAYVALLRAINVTGGNLPMAELKALCEAADLARVRTYIASGNVVFASDRPEARVKADIESRLETRFGRPMPTLIRTAAEMAAIVAANPYPQTPGGRLLVMFLDTAPPADVAKTAVGRAEDELIAPGAREIYIRYGEAGIGRSKLRIPPAAAGTGRNLNTVVKLAAMAAELER